MDGSSSSEEYISADEGIHGNSELSVFSAESTIPQYSVEVSTALSEAAPGTSFSQGDGSASGYGPEYIDHGLSNDSPGEGCPDNGGLGDGGACDSGPTDGGLVDNGPGEGGPDGGPDDGGASESGLTDGGLVNNGQGDGGPGRDSGDSIHGPARNEERLSVSSADKTPPPSSEKSTPPPDLKELTELPPEDPPVPPPRRKRKKKHPSLENLTESGDHSQGFSRSMTVGSSDLAQELSRQAVKTLGEPSSSSQQETGLSSSHEETVASSIPKEASPSSSHEEVTPSCSPKETTPTMDNSNETTPAIDTSIVYPTEDTETSIVHRTAVQRVIVVECSSDSELPVQAAGDKTAQPNASSSERSELKTDKERMEVGSELEQRSSGESSDYHSLTRDSASRSRSVTPTPAISIEPDHGLEWTADVLSLPESEVVTSDTSLAKAQGPGSSMTTSSVLYASDDDSIDGQAEDTPDEWGDGEVDKNGSSKQESEPLPSVPSDSDNAILESTMVTNLDTGEVIPLSAAEEKIPQGHGWSPLSEHLLRRTKEIAEAEGQPGYSFEDEYAPHAQRRKRKKAFIKLKKKKWGRKRDRVGGDEGAGQSEEATLNTEDKYAVKYKQASHKQHKQEFDKVRLKQDLTGTHLGAIWSMEFSICGRLLATAGQDSVVRVWVLATAAVFFHELQSQYQRLGIHSSVDSLSEKASVASTSSSKSSEEDENAGGKLPFQEQPLCSYYGHTADVLDLSWSKNFFLLSSSMDKTVRLWHISRKECLCCFQHVDFVTAIAFHPRDDRYFLSGSLDGKLRLWNIPDKKVALWNEIEGVGSHLITAANFCMNGKLAVVGTYDGRCMFYDTEHLKYHTQIHVKSRHGKNKGRKISGVEPLPGEDKLLVTSNDSRIRLYNLKDHELSCKYKGCLNTSSQIKATFSRDGQYIISGSEDNFIYLWRTHLDVNKLSSARRDRNEFYEGFSSHSAPVTTAVFAPVPGITVDEGIKEVGEIVVAADYQGSIKIYVSGEKL